MTIAATTTRHLLGEVHGLSNDGQVVITVQHWAPGTLITFRNGRRVASERSSKPATARRLDEARAALAASALTDERARELLTEWGHQDERACPSDTCGARLPVGWYRCAECGMSLGRWAAGTVSGASRRPAVRIRIDQR